MLADFPKVQSLLESVSDAFFSPDYWARLGAIEAASGGRGAAWFVNGTHSQWVLRHYRRGGWVARWSADRYLYCGEERVRAFAEWRLLDYARSQGLPVAQPVAARYLRSGLVYRCDLITERIAGAQALSAKLRTAPLGAASWRDIGVLVRHMHALGIDHADLNAHNILLDGNGKAYLIDFDRGRYRRQGNWGRGNLARLQRSLGKIAASSAAHFDAAAWRELMQGYALR
jgi:3-deoxy-D-manno-octulosonic acid kinase